LQKEKGWPKIYFGQATFERIQKEGWEVNYANEKKARELIRSELGMGAYAILAKPAMQELLKNNDVILLESLYSWDEYKIMKQEFGNKFKVIAIWADPETRFKRLQKRTDERPMKSSKEFVVRDYSEIEKTDKGGPIARADFMVVNDGSKKNLHLQINNILRKI